MRATKDELPVLLEAGPSSVRGVDWGELRVAVVTAPAGSDFTPLFEGLPNDRCQGAHWGYVIKGRLRVIQRDGTEEVLNAGDFYHIPPDHTGIAEDDIEFLEIGPPEPHQAFIEAAARNLQKLQAKA
jgi:hypothetical protein